MVDQSTNRPLLRSSSQKPHNQSSPSLPPSQRSTRVTRSRSRDVIEAEESEPVPSRKRRKVASDEENVVESSGQVNKVVRRGARSKGLQGLPAVTEQLAGEGIGRQGQMLRKPEAPRASSPIFGATARDLYSAQDLANLNSRKPRQKKDKEEPPATYTPANISVMEISAAEPKGSAAKLTSSRISNTSFHAPKNLKPAARHLFQRKSESGTMKAFQQDQAQEEVENTRTTESTAVAETTADDIASPGKSRDVINNQTSQPDRPQSALDRHNEGDDSWRPQDFADDEEALVASEKSFPSSPVARARQVVELQASLDAKNNRKNTLEHVNQLIGRGKKSFVDRQDNAERLTFDSQEQVQSVSEDQDQHPLRRQDNVTRDQPAADLQEPSAEDEEGFQQDPRPITGQTRRDKISSGKRPASVPSVRRRLHQEDRVASTGGSASNEIRSAATRHNQGQTPAPSQLENYQTANMVAKFKSSRLREPQIRRPWTNEETEALIELIGEYGTSWTFLKQRDEQERLKRRDQVALKDKARNMKFDFLKAGRFLPHNFEYIPLNKFQIGKLQTMGIDYRVSSATDDES